MHLTRAYRYMPRKDRGARRPGESWHDYYDRAIISPLTACGQPGQQISIYPDGAGEDQVTCPACLEWLAGGDNRLMLLDMDEWIRRHAGDVHYIDIPVPGEEAE